MSYSFSKQASQNKLHDVAFIRAIAVVLVVFFHAYGMMYAPAHFPSLSKLYKEIYYNTNSICLWFHMPLFIFISGYLFSYLYIHKGKYRVFWGRKGFLLNKLKRLILPYVIFSLIFSVSVAILPIQSIVSGEYSHLWFLSMLFWCFILVHILYQLNVNDNSMLTFILLAIFFLSMFLPYSPIRFLGLHYLPRWFFWFWLGCAVFRFRHKLFFTFRKFKAQFTFPVLYLICMYLQIETVGDYGRDVIRYYAETGFLFAVLWVWFIVNACLERYGDSWTQHRIIKELSSCSFGIYIFHNWLEPFMISTTAKSFLPLEAWARDHVVLFPFIFSSLALMLSYILTKILLKTFVGRKLLL